MMLRTLALALFVAFLSVASSAKSIRGNANHNIGSTSDGRILENRTIAGIGNTGRRAYRMFADGVEPEFRDVVYEDGIPQDATADENASPDGRDDFLRREPRIIGGQQAAAGSFRYSASLQARGIGHFCGGSLISPDVVLSAAHCAGWDYSVVIDRRNLNSNNSGQKIAMKREKQHPNYNKRTTNNDFMLVFLDEPVNMNRGAKLIELNSDPSYPPVGQRVTVMGYGDTDPSDYATDLSSKLMEVEVKVISNDDCEDSSGNVGGFLNSYNGQITNSMMCAKEIGKDACQGDSGAPLVVRGSGNNSDKQVGIVSWGIGCATRDFPGVYARVSKEYGWIRKEVCDNSIAPPAWFNCDGIGGVDNDAGKSGGGSEDGSGISNSETGVSGSGNGNTGLGGDSGPVSGGSDSESEIGGSPGDWSNLFNEDFAKGYGRFRDPVDSRFSSQMKGKQGVVRMQRVGTMDTDSIAVEQYSRCRAKVSFMMIGMENNDEMCVEYSSNGDSNYENAKCFNPTEYGNKRWWEGQVASFPVDGANDVRIRIRCKGNNRKDDVLIDAVRLECQ